MDRERAETYLRLLAEAAMRGSLVPAPGAPWGSGTGSEATMVTVGRALAAVGAIDAPTVEEILTEFDLAVRVRQLGRGRAGTAAWVVRGHSIRYAGLGLEGRRARAGPGPAGTGSAAEDGRFVPVGLTVPFRAGAISGELCLMSFAQTTRGARFIAAWDVRTHGLQTRLGPESSGLIPFGEFTVTDDRGARYELDARPGSDPHWSSEISVRPAPPRDIRWLDVAGPDHPAVRVGLRPPRSRQDPAVPPTAGDKPQVSDVKLSPGEHLLIMVAERLLTSAPQAPARPRQRAATPSAPLRAMVAGLGDVVAALEAADVLSPLSPVPARLATLCASLDLDRHGITVPPAAVLPAPWLSLLAHFGDNHRRAVGRGPYHAAAPLGVPVVTQRPNEPWFAPLPPCETRVPCGEGRHVVRWEAGALRLASHADPEAELVLAALGGERPRCMEIAEAWGRHSSDLTVLSVGPRGPADQVAVSWADVEAAAQASEPGQGLSFGPQSTPMRLASPPTADAPHWDI